MSRCSACRWPGGASSHSGTKIVHVDLHATGETLAAAVRGFAASGTAAGQLGPPPATTAVVFTFSLAVPGIAADYLRRDFAALVPPGSLIDCAVPTLVSRLAALPATTTNRKGTRTGDPVNLVVIGEFATLLSALAARWDESETITLATGWKTARAFLLGAQYRYSPVSPLYLFGRSQDVALQRSRHSINERLHLRLGLKLPMGMVCTCLFRSCWSRRLDGSGATDLSP